MNQRQQQNANGRTVEEQSDFERLMQQDAKTRMSYRPLGESEDITISWVMVTKYLCVPTKSGKMPSEQDIMAYMMVCKQRQLNPWAKDCYLTGYDTKDGPKFSVIVAIQALLKRAEINKEFDGLESGIVVLKEDGSVEDRAGDLRLPSEKCIGGWARVHRKDRKVPAYQRLMVSSYKKNSPFWDNDPEGMISKCAEAGALRQAFPSDIGGLYLKEEMQEGSDAKTAVESAKTIADLASRMAMSSPNPKPQDQDREPPPETHDRPQSSEPIDPDLVDSVRTRLEECDTPDLVEQVQNDWLGKCKGDAEANAVMGLCEARRKELAPPAKGGKKQSTLAGVS